MGHRICCSEVLGRAYTDANTSRTAEEGRAHTTQSGPRAVCGMWCYCLDRASRQLGEEDTTAGILRKLDSYFIGGLLP